MLLSGTDRTSLGFDTVVRMTYAMRMTYAHFSDPPAVEVHDLVKTYRRHQALDGLVLTVTSGTVHALLGPNGAGKSTVVSILSTLVRPDSGTARVTGRDVLAEPAAVRRAIGLTGQFAALDRLLTGRENLTMMARLHRVPRRRQRSTVAEALDRFDLTEAADRRVGTYSGGMVRRLDIAASLLARPRVLFLDEPTTGLDPRSRRTVWRFVAELTADGTTVLLTTQYLDEADRLADRVTVLDRGRVVATGTPAELKRRAGTDILHLDRADGTTTGIPTDGSLAGLRRALDTVDETGAPVTAVALRSPSLDDVFLQLTDRTADLGTEAS